MRKSGVLQAEVEIQVPFFDVDSMDVVWHGHYIKYFEVARCALLDHIAWDEKNPYVAESRRRLRVLAELCRGDR